MRHWLPGCRFFLILSRKFKIFYFSLLQIPPVTRLSRHTSVTPTTTTPTTWTSSWCCNSLPAPGHSTLHRQSHCTDNILTDTLCPPHLHPSPRQPHLQPVFQPQRQSSSTIWCSTTNFKIFKLPVRPWLRQSGASGSRATARVYNDNDTRPTRPTNWSRGIKSQDTWRGRRWMSWQMRLVWPGNRSKFGSKTADSRRENAPRNLLARTNFGKFY